MTKTKFRSEIIKKIQAKSILNHPFYVKWSQGRLSVEELRVYAKQYYKFVEHFPRFVSSVHSNCAEPEIRKVIMENLADEEGFKTNVSNHPQLWINFCKALGADRNLILETEAVPEVKDMIEGFYEFCKSPDYRTGLAALLAYEYQIPEVSRIKIEGLKKYYSIDSKEAVEFFTVHEKADIFHREAEMDVLLDKCSNETEQQQILKVIEKAARLYWNMLDGVYVN